MAIIKNKDQEERIVSTCNIKKETQTYDFSLRPQSLKDYVGQQELKSNIHVIIEAAQKRKEPIEHLLFYGPPGLGKTTIAGIIAKELNVNLKITSGPAIERQGDLASIITNLQENDILFIDEIHRLRPIVEEVLYTAMEDFALNLILGKGPSAKTMRLSLPKFTLIGTTTKMSLLSAPFRDRFGHIFKLNFYNESELEDIITANAKKLKMPINPDAAQKIAHSARKTPRLANRLLRRVRDYAQVAGELKITLPMTKKALEALGIDKIGLDHTDRAILNTIIDKFKGGPVGLNTIAAAISEEKATIEEIYEPFLIQLGMLERTARGRIATENAYTHLGLKSLHSKNKQHSFIE